MTIRDTVDPITSVATNIETLRDRSYLIRLALRVTSTQRMRKASHSCRPQGERGLDDDCSVLRVSKSWLISSRSPTYIENPDPVSCHSGYTRQRGMQLRLEISVTECLSEGMTKLMIVLAKSRRARS
jgi:hypothetical protein